MPPRCGGTSQNSTSLSWEKGKKLMLKVLQPKKVREEFTRNCTRKSKKMTIVMKNSSLAFHGHLKRISQERLLEKILALQEIWKLILIGWIRCALIQSINRADIHVISIFGTTITDRKVILRNGVWNRITRVWKNDREEVCFEEPSGWT